VGSVCYEVVEGIVGMKDEIERQRDKTGRLARIERAVCQGSLKEQAARRQRDRETEIQGKKAFQD
jgi:hypothetical protein